MTQGRVQKMAVTIRTEPEYLKLTLFLANFKKRYPAKIEYPIAVEENISQSLDIPNPGYIIKLKPIPSKKIKHKNKIDLSLRPKVFRQTQMLARSMSPTGETRSCWFTISRI